MSIVTLKNKSKQRYNSMSVGRKQFSLNGGVRSTGYVGQDNLSRHFPMTPMRGNVSRGHGGHLGSYHRTNIVSGISNQNDSNVIKSSVVGTYGMIRKKYKWDMLSSTKPDVNMNLNYESSYIKNLEKTTLACINSKHSKQDIETENKSQFSCPNKKSDICTTIKEVGSKTQGQYVNLIETKCGFLDAKNEPSTICRTPF